MNSKRLRLINCSQELLHTILEGDKRLAHVLNVTVPPNWNSNSKTLFLDTLKKSNTTSIDLTWHIYLPIQKRTHTILGTCGFKGQPNKDGIVEIGYEIIQSHRNQGFATEITHCLTNFAFEDNRVTEIIAHTTPSKNSSTRVLEKNNFEFIKDVRVNNKNYWKWRLKR